MACYRIARSTDYPVRFAMLEARHGAITAFEPREEQTGTYLLTRTRNSVQMAIPLPVREKERKRERLCTSGWGGVRVSVRVRVCNSGTRTRAIAKSLRVAHSGGYFSTGQLVVWSVEGGQWGAAEGAVAGGTAGFLGRIGPCPSNWEVDEKWKWGIVESVVVVAREEAVLATTRRGWEGRRYSRWWGSDLYGVRSSLSLPSHVTFSRELRAVTVVVVARVFSNTHDGIYTPCQRQPHGPLPKGRASVAVALVCLD